MRMQACGLHGNLACDTCFSCSAEGAMSGELQTVLADSCTCCPACLLEKVAAGVHRGLLRWLGGRTGEAGIKNCHGWRVQRTDCVNDRCRSF